MLMSPTTTQDRTERQLAPQFFKWFSAQFKGSAKGFEIVARDQG
jgi:hypothetical protein